MLALPTRGRAEVGLISDLICHFVAAAWPCCRAAGSMLFCMLDSKGDGGFWHRLWAESG